MVLKIHLEEKITFFCIDTIINLNQFELKTNDYYVTYCIFININIIFDVISLVNCPLHRFHIGAQ